MQLMGGSSTLPLPPPPPRLSIAKVCAREVGRLYVGLGTMLGLVGIGPCGQRVGHDWRGIRGVARVVGAGDCESCGFGKVKLVAQTKFTKRVQIWGSFLAETSSKSGAMFALFALARSFRVCL